MDVLKERLAQAEHGKAIFKEMFDLDSLNIDDTFGVYPLRNKISSGVYGTTSQKRSLCAIG